MEEEENNNQNFTCWQKIKLLTILLIPWIVILFRLYYNERSYNDVFLVVWHLFVFFCYCKVILKYITIVVIPIVILIYSEKYFSSTECTYFVLFYSYCSWSAYHPRSFKICLIILLPWFLAFKYMQYYNSYTYRDNEDNGINRETSYIFTPTADEITELTFMDGNIY